MNVTSDTPISPPETPVWVKTALGLLSSVMFFVGVFFFNHTQSPGHAVTAEKIVTAERERAALVVEQAAIEAKQRASEQAMFVFMAEIRDKLADLETGQDDRYRRGDALEFQRKVYEEFADLKADMRVLKEEKGN